MVMKFQIWPSVCERRSGSGLSSLYQLLPEKDHNIVFVLSAIR